MSVTVFVPYRERAPQTTDVRELRAEHLRCVAEHGRSSHEAAESWQRWSEASFRQDRPLDALRRYVGNEVERFFACTILGADGHVYWDGPQRFVRNDDRQRLPRLWWWERDHPPLGRGDSVVSTCGERNCINPEHCEKQDRRARHLIFADDRMIGLLQATAMRLGHPPTQRWWRSTHQHPSLDIYRQRFGTWARALRSAGLKPNVKAGTDETDCIHSLRHARHHLGRTPTLRDYRDDLELRESLKKRGLPTSSSAIKKHCGGWDAALREAFGALR